MSYDATERIVPHPVNRIELVTNAPFAQLRTRFEAEVPEVDPADMADLVAGDASWEDFVRGLAYAAPNGFVRLWSEDPTAIMRFAGSEAASAAYLIGDYAIAARVFRYDPAAMLYVPLRVELHSDRTGRTVLAVDQPSSHLASFEVNKMTQAGYELDRRLGDLLEALDLPRPSVLRL
jgi:hypothetical protein